VSEGLSTGRITLPRFPNLRGRVRPCSPWLLRLFLPFFVHLRRPVRIGLPSLAHFCWLVQPFLPWLLRLFLPFFVHLRRPVRIGLPSRVRLGLPSLLALSGLILPSQSADAYEVIAGDETSLELSGYVKNFFLAVNYAQDSIYPEHPDAWDVVSIRLKARARLPGQLRLDAAFEVQPSSAPPALALGGISTTGQATTSRIWRDPDPWIEGGSLTVRQQIDRLALTWSPTYFDLTVGRQAISFGSARVINPTDLFAPFEFTDIDQEEKGGVDAIRLTVPIGALSMVEAFYVAGEDLAWKQSAAALRAQTTLGTTDVAGLVAIQREASILGAELAGSLAGLGLWLEGTYTHPSLFTEKTLEDPPQDSPDPYVRLSLGLDFQLPVDLYTFAEYDLNTAGLAELGQLDQPLPTPVLRGETTFLGRHYLTIGSSYPLHPLLRLQLAGVINLEDPSALLSPQADLSLSDDIALVLGAYLSAGEPPALVDGTESSIEAPTEMGLYPDFYYMQLLAYF